MQDAISVIFDHSVVPAGNTSLALQHTYRPEGRDSWCAYKSDMETGKATYHDDKIILRHIIASVQETIFK